MQVVVQTVNFIQATGLNHRQFNSLLRDKAFFIYVGKLKTLCANNPFPVSLNQEQIQGGNWGDHPPKTYESNFFHYDFVHFGKQHLRLRPVCHPLFCHSSVVKYTSSLLQ